MIRQIKTTWTGIRPLILHNGMLCDRKYTYTRQIKALTDKGVKMTDTDHETRDELEWNGSLYVNPAGQIAMPSDNIEACITAGAKKTKKGKDVNAGVFVSADDAFALIKFDRPKGVKVPKDLFKYPDYQMRKGVVLNRNRVIRVRPMLPTGWSITFTLEYDTSIINGRALITAMTTAGMYIGLGDWRPKFGRFTVEILEGGDVAGEQEDPAAEGE